jgi:hypothetical protein
MRMMTLCTVRLAAVGVAGLMASSCGLDAGTFGTTGSFEQTLQVTGRVNLTVRTGSGTIHIHSGPSDRIHVIGAIHAYGSWFTGMTAEEQIRRIEAEPPLDQKGSTITIGDISDFSLRQNVNITYDVTVPFETRVESRTGSGSQSIDGIRGPLDARAGSGSIRIGHIGGRVSATTGSGSIELGEADGGFEASAGSGSIRGDEIAGAIRARTGSGRVELAQTQPEGIDVTTGSGSIKITGARGAVHLRAGSGRIDIAGVPLSGWALHTGSGRIMVHFPSDARFDLDARVGSGSIRTEHPVETTGTISRRSIQGKVRGGGPLVEISTGSGGAEID